MRMVEPVVNSTQEVKDNLLHKVNMVPHAGVYGSPLLHVRPRSETMPKCVLSTSLLRFPLYAQVRTKLAGRAEEAVCKACADSLMNVGRLV